MSYKSFIDEVNINNNHLDSRYLSHFQSDSLLDKLSSILCKADIISKKEYCESMEVIKSLQRTSSLHNVKYIYDICGGHGLTAIFSAIISKNTEKIFIIDLKKPDSFDKLINCYKEEFPYILERIEFVNEDYNKVQYLQGSLIIAVHACGFRTDEILDLAIENSCNILIMPCCYKKKSLTEKIKKYSDIYPLRDLVDVTRIMKLHSSGYSSCVRLIPEKITPMNKLFIFLKDESDKIC